MKVVYFYEKGRCALETSYTLPPGPKGLPFLGNVLHLKRDQLGFLLDVQRRYQRMATIYVGRTPIVLLFRPEHVRYVLTENPRNFTNREVAGGLIFGKLLLFSLLSHTFSHQVTEGIRDMAGDFLLTTDGEYHDRQRRLLQSAFSRRRIERYRNMIVQYTQETVDAWRPEMEVDLVREMQALVLRIIINILLNIDVLKEETNFTEIIEDMLDTPTSMIEGILNLTLDLPFVPFGKRMSATRKADAYIHAFIERRLASADDEGDILSILLSAEDENGNKIPKKEVRDAIASLIAAGHETSTNTLVWTIYLLAEHPDVFEKVQAELQNVLGGRDPELSDLPQL